MHNKKALLIYTKLFADLIELRSHRTAEFELSSGSIIPFVLYITSKASTILYMPKGYYRLRYLFHFYTYKIAHIMSLSPEIS